jgi:hypothetical protein
MESRAIIDTQYAVHAAYYATNDAANDSSHGTRVVLTDASAMIGAFRHALSVRTGRHCERHGADEYDVSNHVYLCFEVKVCANAPEQRTFPQIAIRYFAFNNVGPKARRAFSFVN